MIEFIIAIAVFILLAFLWRRRKNENAASTQTQPQAKPETPAQPVIQAEEKIIAVAKPVVEPVITPAVKPQQVAVSSSATALKAECCNKNLPQDSMLRRHYLTHVAAMISSLNAPRPTDSGLSRHYDAHIAAELERCINDKQAMQQLAERYQQGKQTVISVCPAPVVTATSENILVEQPVTAIDETPAEVPAAVVSEPCHNTLPQDSMLKRHYLTQLHAQVAASLPVRPTDSSLRRHYDSLLENAVQQLLN